MATSKEGTKTLAGTQFNPLFTADLTKQ
jgi:hypothetical protein